MQEKNALMTGGSLSHSIESSGACDLRRKEVKGKQAGAAAVQPSEIQKPEEKMARNELMSACLKFVRMRLRQAS